LANSPAAAPIRLERLKKRADFLRAARTARKSGPSFTLELCPTPGEEAAAATLRVGFTATKKLGNAVIRNRAKRRLRAAAAAVLPLYGLAGHDYVLVARTGTLTRPFAGLLEDLAAALEAGHARLNTPQGSARGPATGGPKNPS
jgi:ribonuclease P protein component